MLASRQIRLQVVQALATVAGIGDLVSPGDWDTPPKKLPQVKVRAPDDRKVGQQRGMPTFTTTVTIEIEVKLQADDAAQAQDLIEDLVDRVLTAVLCRQQLIALIQTVSGLRTRIAINAEGQRHEAGALLEIDFETFEVFDPTTVQVLPDLDNLRVHVDTIEPFDADGTYADPPFPDSVQPAPRTAGPDGRDEGGLNLDLTQ